MATTALKQEVNGKWPLILHSLGVSEHILSGKHQPCPFCGGKDRFRFTDKGGDGMYYCRCSQGDGFTLLEKLYQWDFKTAAREVERVAGRVQVRYEPKPEFDVKRALHNFIAKARRVRRNDATHRYLLARGLSTLPSTLWTHPAAFEKDSRRSYRAMLGILTDVNDDPVSIHRTFLDAGSPRGYACKKLMPGIRSVKGCAIRLWPARDEVVLTEGIENAIAVHEMTGIPAWACVSTVFLESVRLPTSIKRVSIYGDNDGGKSYAGQKASYVLAERLVSEGRQVQVRIPEKAGADWLDFWLDRRVS